MSDDHRAERRRLARRHHPDLGGDACAFAEAMRELDERTAATPAGAGAAAPQVEVVVTWRGRTTRVVRSARERTRPLTSLVRRRLPSSFPGARRYGRL